jgi:hypothetical protein
MNLSPACSIVAISTEAFTRVSNLALYRYRQP